jgi:diguanylate cyclase (GGDEF)-like protein
VTRRGRKRVSNPLFAAVGLAIAVETVIATLTAGPPSGTLDDALVLAVLALPVLAFLFGAADQPEARVGWLLIGAGIAFNSIGEAYFFFAERTLTAFPTLGDVFCLALFPPMVAGIVLIARSDRDRARLSIGIDAVIIALAIGTLAYELIFNLALGSASVPKLVGGELAYPILDLLVLTLLAVVCLPSRFRVGGAYICLLAGMAILLVTDVANLRATSQGGYSPDTALYFGWGLGIVVLAASSRFSSSLVHSEMLRGRFLVVSLGGAMMLSLVLLVQEAAHDQNPVVIGGGVAALVLGLWRLFRSLAENSRLIAERDEVIARQEQLQAELRRLAEQDPLTGLANRRRFAERLDEHLRFARRYRHSGALLFIDLDSFKFINDSFGHPVGDRVLREVGAAIRGSLRSTDTAARLGGDEFAVLLPELGENGAMGVAEKLLAAIQAGTDPVAGASAGIVCFGPDQSFDAEDLLIAADLALYEAKASGRGGVSVYRGQKGMTLTWVERIREALKEDRLRLYAQPIVDVHSGEVEREELLVRMIDRDGREIPPSSFLPTAERFGLIGDIDRLTVGHAIDLAREGRPVAVNISGTSVTDRWLIERVAAAIEAGMDPRLLSFELTETSGIANIEAARRFAAELEGLGCDLALDDFGTGLSSLGYLRHLPIQTLKIDTEFIKGMSDSAFDRYLVQTIVGLARRLGQKTVAEGVEDEATLAMVRMFGVDYAQGYLFDEPTAIESKEPRAALSSAAH